MNSEVPLLQEHDLIKNALLAKGKSHYYCHKEMLNHQFPQEESIIDKLSSYYRDGYTGQRDEFEKQYGDISNRIWNQVSLKATKKECERCNYSLQCPSFQHRNRFLQEQNDLVITNHEQLIRSVLNRLSEQRFPPIVPRPRNYYY